MMKRKRNESGQAAVEFTIFTIMLVLMLMLIIQLMWIGVQKWQFNHIAAYTARRWTVYKNESPAASFIKVVGVGTIFQGWPVGSNYVIGIPPSQGTSNSMNGLTFRGGAEPFPLFKGWIGGYIGFGIFMPIIDYVTFIPMQKEPNENTNGHDNDCNDTPCSGGNRR